jgi:UDP-arabinose 4-epimerase
MTDKVLVTGGAGFVGSHACKALAQAGFLPVTFDNLETGHEWAVKWGPLVRGDIRDPVALEAAMAAHAPVAVLHFAGLIAVGESVADPARYHDYNVAGSRALLAAMAAQNVQRIVFSSSAAVYGRPDAVPIEEHHPTRPENPYGSQKREVETMLAAAGGGLRSISLRYFNAAGADPDGDLGEAHDPETHLIPLILQAALGTRPEIQMFGDDYPTPDGTCIRDYVHVSDLAAAHVSGIKRLLSVAEPNSAEIFNLGSGTGHSVREVVETAVRVTGRPDIPVRVSPRRPGDVPILVASADRARQDLGWRPRYPDLETQVRHAWAWMTAHGG